MRKRREAFSHSGGKVEPLARILLLVLSAIWNVQSLPLSDFHSNRAVLSLSVPSLCSDSLCRATGHYVAF